LDVIDVLIAEVDAGSSDAAAPQTLSPRIGILVIIAISMDTAIAPLPEPSTAPMTAAVPNSRNFP
jgi:hypothetical protein